MLSQEEEQAWQEACRPVSEYLPVHTGPCWLAAHRLPCAVRWEACGARGEMGACFLVPGGHRGICLGQLASHSRAVCRSSSHGCHGEHTGANWSHMAAISEGRCPRAPGAHEGNAQTPRGAGPGSVEQTVVSTRDTNKTST